MVLKEVLDRTTQFLKEKQFPSARLESELLISGALGLRRIDLYLKFEQPLAEAELQKCRDFLRRRVAGEPVAYILQKKDFFHHTFYVDGRVLIPRPETEQLVEAALEFAKNENLESFRCLDLGSGSGCIGLSVAKENQQVEAVLVDISAEASAVQAINVKNLAIEDRVKIINASVQKLDLSSVGKFEIVLANPPYIATDDSEVEENVKKFEPHLALFAEDKGLKQIREWAETLSGFLSEKAFVGFEVGMNQGESVKNIFTELGVFKRVEIVKDFSERDRFIYAYNF